MSRLDLAGRAEELVVGLARAGNRDAFEELVGRYQVWLRSLMYRLSGNNTLTDDLAQEAFLQAWRKIRGLRDTGRFGGWLKRIAITTWLSHLRRHDPLRFADSNDRPGVGEVGHIETPGIGMDLDRALLTLLAPVRLCVVLSYQENMTHPEIAEATNLPVGTVKSHIRRGSQHLRQLLVDYKEAGDSNE